MRCADARHKGRLQVIDPHSDSDAPVRFGDLVDDRYIILGLLGEGAMGKVYRAFQRFFSRDVALKVVDLARAQPSERQELGARFIREIKVLALVDSPRIARVFDSGALPDGSLYYAMERVVGDSLDKVLLVEGPLHAPRVLALAAQLAEALAAVHRAGLVHRDIKPANLMSTRGADGRESLKLVDFGIARPQGQAHLQTVGASLTTEGAILGSFPYMAPEQFSAGSTPASTSATSAIGPWTDVYAAGITLFELLTGRPPFPGPTAPAYVHQHLSARIPRLVDCAGHLDESPSVLRLDAIIQRALAKDASLRPRDGAALLKLLTDGDADATPSPSKGRDSGLGHSGSPRRPSDSARDLSAQADPAALVGVSAERVLERIAALPAPKRPRTTKGRIAMTLAILLGLTDIVWTLVS